MKNLLNKILLLAFLSANTGVFSQNTIGLLYSDINTTEGYTLFTPEKNTSVYLINNCGEVVNEWTFSENPGISCYLLDNGNLLRAGKDSLQIRDWNNSVVWTYAMNDNGLLQHHDIEPLPNGNILCVITDRYTAAEAIAVGRDPNNVATNFKLDKIVELQPVGIDNANIVWEWKFIDHFVQDFDNTKPNFGVVINSPELIDINYDNGYDNDYTHVNGIDYNSSLDQIIISTRHLSEIHIIDHSTTLAEAASHSGGNSGMGGDIIWRWGNPAVYDQGTITDQKLFKQHDAKWVQDGYLDDGKISVFNNEGTSASTYSSIHLIEPEIINGIYTKDTGKFKPLNFDWSWNGTIMGTLVYQNKKSGVQSLQNGNMLICESFTGRVSEINKNGDHLWTYIVPHGQSFLSQFSTPTNNGIFRAEKYPSNFIGFVGNDLTPQGIIENQNDSSAACILTTDVQEKITLQSKIGLYPNPTSNELTIQSNSKIKSITIIDLTGKKIKKEIKNKNSISVNELYSGIYFIEILTLEGKFIEKFIKE
jgi:hypothetical protein